MASTSEAAAKILEGFEHSNGTFSDIRMVDKDTIESYGKLSGPDLEQAKNVDRAVSQLVAAVGTEIKHSAIVNAPSSDPQSRSYHCAVFGAGVLGYVEFASAGNDPKILVQVVPRSSITGIEVRAAKNYHKDKGDSLVFVVKYTSGIKLDIRQRDSDGVNVPEEGAWVQDLLDGLREDLAAT